MIFSMWLAWDVVNEKVMTALKFQQFCPFSHMHFSLRKERIWQAPSAPYWIHPYQVDLLSEGAEVDMTRIRPSSAIYIMNLSHYTLLIRLCIVSILASLIPPAFDSFVTWSTAMRTLCLCNFASSLSVSKSSLLDSQNVNIRIFLSNKINVTQL